MEYQIKLEYQAKVLDDAGAVVFTTRPCRLEVQARRLAQDWIDAQMGIVDDCSSITLEVQNLVIDPGTLFGGKKRNG